MEVLLKMIFAWLADAVHVEVALLKDVARYDELSIAASFAQHFGAVSTMHEDCQ